jgi:hypothetical protein
MFEQLVYSIAKRSISAGKIVNPDAGINDDVHGWSRCRCQAAACPSAIARSRTRDDGATFQAQNQRFGNALAADLLRFDEQLVWQVCRHAPGGCGLTFEGLLRSYACMNAHMTARQDILEN